MLDFNKIYSYKTWPTVKIKRTGDLKLQMSLIKKNYARLPSYVFGMRQRRKKIYIFEGWRACVLCKGNQRHGKQMMAERESDEDRGRTNDKDSVGHR